MKIVYCVYYLCIPDNNNAYKLLVITLSKIEIIEKMLFTTTLFQITLEKIPKKTRSSTALLQPMTDTLLF